MKNKRINLVAALTFGVLALASGSVCAQTTPATEKSNDEIEIITLKDDAKGVESIFNENVLNVNCGCAKPFAKAVKPRMRAVGNDCGCETGAAIPPPCPCEPAPCAPEPAPCNPCDVSPACPIADPCEPCQKDAPAPCDPCVIPVPAPCDPCDVSPACPVAEPCDPCKKTEVCPVAPCEKNCGPACATSPSFDKDNLARLQVYAYPRYLNLWGNDISASNGTFNNGSYASGVMANNDCGCNTGLNIFNNKVTTGLWGADITGAAAGIAGIPVQNNPCLGMAPAVPVDNSATARANHGCPITIHTTSSVQVPHMGLEKLDIQQVTGAAVPLTNTFDDVPSGYWASLDINKLAASKVIAGYPDQTFRPDRKVTRAEFAALAVSGLNYQGEKYYDKAIFSDVPQHHWANSVIDKGVNGGLIAGYPNGLFKPNAHVTRAEALVILAKALPSCEMDDCKANEILSHYTDCASIPAWAKVPVAKAIQADALKKSPDCDNLIRGNDLATRAEIAGMLSNIRITLGIDPSEIACGCAETGAAAYVEVEEMKQYPTLKVKFDDQITAKDSQAGDGFRAYSTECVTIDGVTYPEGSIVRGKIVEVIRPSHNCKGALRIVFTEIENGDCKSALPAEVLSAQVLNTKNPNIVSKVLKAPFTWAGAIVGNTARTVGNFIVQAGNGVEAVANDFGTGTGELFQGKFKASMRSYGQSALELLKTPVQMTTTAVSGVAGLAEVTVDELAYVVSPNGTRISQISPNEVVQVAFGTCPKTASK